MNYNYAREYNKRDCAIAVRENYPLEIKLQKIDSFTSFLKKNYGFLFNIEHKHCGHMNTHAHVFIFIIHESEIEWVWNNGMRCNGMHCIHITPLMHMTGGQLFTERLKLMKMDRKQLKLDWKILKNFSPVFSVYIT